MSEVETAYSNLKQVSRHLRLITNLKQVFISDQEKTKKSWKNGVYAHALLVNCGQGSRYN